MAAKRKAKLLISGLWFAAASVSRILTGRPRRRLTILYYHAVPAVQRGSFARQMRQLSRAADLVQADHDGPLSGRRPTVAVTFDDAFVSVRDNGLPALVENGVPATIFVPSGYLGRPPGWAMETAQDRQEVVMSADEIRSLPGGLIRIGSHTIDHPRLSTLTPDEIDMQLTQSRLALETLTGKVIDTLAFPYGDHDDRVVSRCVAAGYRQVYSVSPEAVDPRSGHIKRGRTAADPSDGPLEFYLKMQGAYSWMPIASRIKRSLKSRSS